MKRIAVRILCLLMLACSIFTFAACKDKGGEETQTLADIYVVCMQGGTLVYADTPLDNIREFIVVTAEYSDGKTAVVRDYSLSGILNSGESVVTVSYQNCQKTFTVRVSERISDAHPHPLTMFNEKAATCTEDGHTAYWHCATCDTYYADRECTTELTAEDVLIPKTHTGGTEIRNAKEATQNEEGYTGDTYCLGCGTMITPGTVIDRLQHVHAMQKTNRVDATCTADGNIEYWYCATCEKYYSDASAETEITLADTVIAAGHTGGTQTIGAYAPNGGTPGYTGDTYCLGCGDLLTSGENYNHILYLYMNNEPYQTLCVVDAENYTLPMPAVSSGMRGAWFDSVYEAYTDADGKLIKTLSERTELHYYEYTDGYTPIFTVAQLSAVAPAKSYYLMRDLDLGGAVWSPLEMKGVFNGGEHVISNFRITANATNVGFFKYNEGTIENLGLENFSVTVSGVSSAVGGLVGHNIGTVTNCYVKGCDIRFTSMTVAYAGVLIGQNGNAVNDCYAEGSISVTSSFNLACVGGLVGANGGTVESCYATSAVATESTSQSGFCYGGGLVGYNNDGSIYTSYASGNVQVTTGASSGCAGGLIGSLGRNGSVTGCSASGDATVAANTGSGYAGGLIGYNVGGTVTSCYATGAASATSEKASAYIGGLVGMNGGTVNSCYATGAAVGETHSANGSSFSGGLVGRNENGTVKNSYATGSVSATVTSLSGAVYGYGGGLVGYNNTGLLTNCYAAGNVSVYAQAGTGYSTAYAGGLLGFASKGTVTDCYRSSSQSFTLSQNGSVTYAATNTLGTEQNMSTLQSVTFQRDTLRLPSSYWSFGSGSNPTLKHVANGM